VKQRAEVRSRREKNRVEGEGWKGEGVILVWVFMVVS
jgi:hypothetical protein